MTIFVHLFIRSVIPKVTMTIFNNIWHQISYLVYFLPSWTRNFNIHVFMDTGHNTLLLKLKVIASSNLTILLTQMKHSPGLMGMASTFFLKCHFNVTCLIVCVIFKFLKCQLTYGFFFDKSHYMSKFKLCVSMDVHFYFVQVFARQKPKTCKNFVKHIHYSHLQVLVVLQNKSHWINMMKLAKIVEHANKTIGNPHVSKTALAYSKIFKLCSFGSPNTRMQVRVWVSLK
jgi:hypothetical protein